jgi:hypothetical protein
VQIEVLKEPPAQGLSRATLEEHVVGEYDGRTTVDVEDGGDVLDEVELLATFGPDRPPPTTWIRR